MRVQNTPSGRRELDLGRSKGDLLLFLYMNRPEDEQDHRFAAVPQTSFRENAPLSIPKAPRGSTVFVWQNIPFISVVTPRYKEKKLIK
jgi:hypothetical protein